LRIGSPFGQEAAVRPGGEHLGPALRALRDELRLDDVRVGVDELDRHGAAQWLMP